MATGHVYIMFNSEMPHCLKIGQTTREPEVRAKELSGTSSPKPFRVLMQWKVTDVTAAESAAHEMLADRRVDPQREFFRISPPEAIDCVGRAIRPFLCSHLDEKLRDDITEACTALAKKYFEQDFRVGLFTPTHPNVYQRLSRQLQSIALNAAINLTDNLHDPSVILSILDILDLYLEPVHSASEQSPEVLLFLISSEIRLFADMMTPDTYLMVGAPRVSANVLDITSTISRTISIALNKEEHERNLLEGNY
jgi:hypothetical protein